MAGIFKAYDVRGKIDTLDDETVYKIGAGFARMLQEEEGRKDVRIIVGYDMRETSPRMAQAISDGVIDMGADVVDIGLVTTPMSYFAAANIEAQGGVMVTASHNPKEYNGMKFTRTGGISLTYEGGIEYIEHFVKNTDLTQLEEMKVQQVGKIEERDIKKAYMQFMIQHTNIEEPLKVVVDAGNGMAGLDVPVLAENVPHLSLVPMYFDLDGTFPNHEANPLRYETLKDLQNRVVEEKADFGAAFDGDADRVVFIDEKGQMISADLITALVAKERLEEMSRDSAEKPKILYDLRSSRIIREIVEEYGGQPIMCRVGHSYIQELMIQHDAIFAGELSGHYYFKEFYNCDNGMFMFIQLLNLCSATEKTLSELM
ncbi:MAG: phosphomannomutase/phosphoglucomutase, partial [Nanoarchaeota archaeon]